MKGPSLPPNRSQESSPTDVPGAGRTELNRALRAATLGSDCHNRPPCFVWPGLQATTGRSRGAHQYLLDALLNGHEPAVVVFGEEGTSFSDPQTKWKADHGGPTWESQHVPLVLAGAGITAGEVIDSPAQLEDVAPTVLAAMGASHTGMAGQVLTDALVQASSEDQRARDDEISWLTPVVQALTDEEASERPRA